MPPPEEGGRGVGNGGSMFFKKYIFGKSAVYYVETPVEGHENKTVIGLAVYPKNVKVEPEKLCLDSLVQVAFTGDEALIDYTLGVTMRNRSSTLLKVKKQTRRGNSVTTVLTDEFKNTYTHVLNYAPETGVFTTYVRYFNDSDAIRTLEMLSSFSLSGITSVKGGCRNTMGLSLSRMTSAWSRECRLKTEKFSDLGFDMSWARYGVKVEKFGQIGSMPNRGYYPFAAVGDEKFCLGVQIEAPYSWQIELYEEKESCAFSGGLGDYESAHWRKEILPGESFESGKAFFTLQKDLTAVCNALVHEQERLLSVPASEEEMPVMYNEYCATWGNPTQELMLEMMDALKALPQVKYFVIDSGWYKPEDRGWCNAIGDWDTNRKIFPDLSVISQKAKSMGMKAGIWYEFEVAGRDSKTFYQEDMLLHRDGHVLTSKNRRFLDLRTEKAERFLREKLLKQLKESGFEYIKIDYNDNIGTGCDSEDGASLGEGGRQVTEASLEWLEKLKEEIPALVIENCSSGGSRIEPRRMQMVSMCSFSDAHECPEIPLVAANVSRVIPARQEQIWAVLRGDERDSRTIYSLCAAMMGRICLSGDILKLSEEKFKLIQRGLDFYEKIKHIVRFGDIKKIDCNVEYYRNPKGRQVYVKEYEGKRLVIVHFLDDESEVKLSAKGYRLLASYTDLKYEMGEKLAISGEKFHAGAWLLEKEN